MSILGFLGESGGLITRLITLLTHIITLVMRIIDYYLSPQDPVGLRLCYMRSLSFQAQTAAAQILYRIII